MPDAAITQNSVNEDFSFNQRSQAMSLAENTKYINPFLDPDLTRKPEYFVYVYSVVDPRPDGYHLIRNAPPLIHNLRIAELKAGERYTLVTTIPHPVNQAGVDPSNEQRVNWAHNGQRVAQDVVNPENITMNQDASMAADRSFAEGNDFGKLGVFWSLNNPPTDEEVAKAIKRKETFYRRRLDQARALEASSPKDLALFLSPTDHIAVDYFARVYESEEQFSWHKVMRMPDKCPNCGESIKSGVAFHASAALGGMICVIDWKRTVEAGVKKLKDVPESKRWKEQVFTGEMGE
jgi:hypothetical protein